MHIYHIERSFSVVAIALAFASGCSPFAQNPLSDPQAAKVHAELYGHWRLQTDSRTRNHFIVEPASPPHPAGMMKFSFYFDDLPGPYDGIWDGHCFVTESGNTKFINFFSGSRAGHRGYSIAKLDTWNKGYFVSLLSEGLTAKAVADGLLDGTTSMGITRLTESSDKLRSILSSDEGKTLFSPPGHLQFEGTAEQFFETRNKRIEQARVERELETARIQEQLAASDAAQQKRLAAFAAESQAAEEAKFREWTSADGKRRVNAKFVRFTRYGQCVLQFRDDQTIAVNLNQLSKADQEYIRDLRTNEAKQLMPFRFPAQ